MSRAPRIDRLLGLAEPTERVEELRRALSVEDCEGSVHHSPRPLLVHRYDLSDPFDGLLMRIPQDAESDRSVRLCGTCVDNLGLYLTMLLTFAGAPPEAVKRDFGNPIRSLGDRSWDYWMSLTKERVHRDA